MDAYYGTKKIIEIGVGMDEDAGVRFRWDPLLSYSTLLYLLLLGGGKSSELELIIISYHHYHSPWSSTVTKYSGEIAQLELIKRLDRNHAMLCHG
jgi:hypothetical protein